MRIPPMSMDEANPLPSAIALEDYCNDISEWLAMVSLQSPRISVDDIIDPYLSRYAVPESESIETQPTALVSLRWQGAMTSRWITQLFTYFLWVIAYLTAIHCIPQYLLFLGVFVLTMLWVAMNNGSTLMGWMSGLPFRPQPTDGLLLRILMVILSSQCQTEQKPWVAISYPGNSLVPRFLRKRPVVVPQFLSFGSLRLHGQMTTGTVYACRGPY